MFEMPVNEGQETVAAFLMDLQLFADDSGGDAGGSAAAGGGDGNTGASSSDADASGGAGTGDNDGSAGDGNSSGVVDQNADGSDGASGEAKKQSPEADRAFAEMRRQKEAAEKAAVKAKEEVQKERDAKYAEKFGHMGIFTEQQYWAAVDREKQQKEATKREQEARMPKQYYDELIAKGYDPKVAEGLADGLATKIKLKQLEEQVASERQLSKQEKEQLREQQRREVIGKQIIEDHKALSQKYGELVPSDLKDLDEATKEMMRQGAPLKAAWLATHEDEIIEFAKSGGAKKALKNVSSKNHLQSEKSGAGEVGKQVDLSPEQLRVWRGMGYNESEARKRAAKYAKQGR